MKNRTHQQHRVSALPWACLTALLLAAALPAKAESGQSTSRNLTSGERERSFHLYVPSSLDPAQPAPLLFCLHGAGGSGLAEMKPFRRLADEHGFLLVGPDGINKRWNAGCRDEIEATGDADDVAFVQDLVKAIAGEFKVDHARVYACGFSNGAALAHRLAAELPETFAAIAAAGAAMARNTAENLQPGSPVSILIMVGDEDPMFGKEGNLRGGTFLTAAETAKTWAQHNACGEAFGVNAPVPFTRWPASTDVGEVELWVVAGGGHSPALSKAFNTADESWKFLARQNRERKAGPTVYEGWPFDSVEAARRQDETARATAHPVVLESPLGGDGGPVVKWRLIPAGTFIMGSPLDENGHEGDERQHPETVGEPFYMMETQLTLAQYRALLHRDPADVGDGRDPRIPAGMPYRDMVDHVLPALAKHAPAGWKVILPDRVRLEYAARAGVAAMNPGGNAPEDAAAHAWTKDNSGGKVHPVAQKRANPWGLYDVLGNRWHWHWRAGAGYGHDSTKNHIVYGGSWRDRPRGNGARLANINISERPEGARFALISEDSPAPEGHPETRPTRP